EEKTDVGGREGVRDGIRAMRLERGADARASLEAAADGARVRGEVRVTVTSDKDIVTASRRGRRIAEDSGFASSDPTPIATATSELARNVFWYATQGEIIFRLIENGARGGIEIIALDEGPGICRSEERRVGKEGRCGWVTVGLKKKQI